MEVIVKYCFLISLHYIFRNKDFYYHLLKYLSNPYNKDLKKAIKTAYAFKRKKRFDKDNFLFVLSGGLIHYKYKKEIKEYSEYYRMVGMKVFEIRLGIYPIKSQNN